MQPCHRCIVDGDVPDGFTLKRLRHGIPDDWDDQRREFGSLQPVKCRNRRFWAGFRFFLQDGEQMGVMHYIILCMRGIRLPGVIQPKEFHNTDNYRFSSDIASSFRYWNCALWMTEIRNFRIHAIAHVRHVHALSVSFRAIA